MSRPIVSDYELRLHIRRVLSRHWIDLPSLRIQCSQGIVRLQGILQRIDGSPCTGGNSLAEAVDVESRRAPGVRSVYMDLENWTQDNTGSWQQRTVSACTSTSDSDGGSQDLTDEEA